MAPPDPRALAALAASAYFSMFNGSSRMQTVENYGPSIAHMALYTVARDFALPLQLALHVRRVGVAAFAHLWGCGGKRLLLQRVAGEAAMQQRRPSTAIVQRELWRRSIMMSRARARRAAQKLVRRHTLLRTRQICAVGRQLQLSTYLAVFGPPAPFLRAPCECMRGSVCYCVSIAAPLFFCVVRPAS